MRIAVNNIKTQEINELATYLLKKWTEKKNKKPCATGAINNRKN